MQNSISIVAVLISLGALGWPVFLYFINRPRLNIFLRDLTFKDKAGKKTDRNMTQICFINDGQRSVTISQLNWENKNGARCSYGIYDESKAPHGIAEKVLPMIIGSAEMKTINWLNAEQRDDVKSVTLIDSYGYKIYFDENMTKKMNSPRENIISFERCLWKKMWKTK